MALKDSYAYGDSIAGQIADVSGISKVSINGIGLFSSVQPKVSDLPKQVESVTISLGWNDAKYMITDDGRTVSSEKVDGRIQPQKQTVKPDDYKKLLVERINEIKKQTSTANIVVLGLQFDSDVKEYGTKEQLTTINKALEEASKETEVTYYLPNFPAKRAADKVHYAGGSAMTLFDKAQDKLNSSSRIMLAKNEVKPDVTEKPPELPKEPVVSEQIEPPVLVAETTTKTETPAEKPQVKVPQVKAVTEKPQPKTEHSVTRHTQPHVHKQVRHVEHNDKHHHIQTRKAEPVVQHDDFFTRAGRTLKKFFSGGFNHHEAASRVTDNNHVHDREHHEPKSRKTSEMPKHHRTAAQEEAQKLKDKGISQVHSRHGPAPDSPVIPNNNVPERAR